MFAAPEFKVLSTCPPSASANPDAYLLQLREIAGCSELAGYRTFGLDVPADSEELRHIGITCGTSADSLAA